MKPTQTKLWFILNLKISFKINLKPSGTRFQRGVLLGNHTFLCFYILVNWPFYVSIWHFLSSIPSPELVLAQTSSDPVYSGSDVEAGMFQFPPPGSGFKKEEEEHEEEAGADVQDHTQTHVHTVKTQTQDPHSSSCSSLPPHVSRPLLPILSSVSLVSGSWCRLLLNFLLGLLPLCSSTCSLMLLLRPAGLYGIRVWRRWR